REAAGVAAKINARPIIGDVLRALDWKLQTHGCIFPIEETYEKLPGLAHETDLQRLTLEFSGNSGWRKQSPQNLLTRDGNLRQIVAGEHHAAAGVDCGCVKQKFIVGQISGQQDRVGIVPP